MYLSPSNLCISHAKLNLSVYPPYHQAGCSYPILSYPILSNYWQSRHLTIRSSYVRIFNHFIRKGAARPFRPSPRLQPSAGRLSYFIQALGGNSRSILFITLSKTKFKTKLCIYKFDTVGTNCKLVFHILSCNATNALSVAI